MLIGREAERKRVSRALETARQGGSAALVVLGEPGIGKTALLQEAIAAADGMTVLRLRGLEAEAELPFAGLAELCRPVVGLRKRLPAAQASALAGALQLEAAAPQARLAIGAALLGLLALAAEERPVLCAVDDLQWVDEPTLEALRFAVRRLGAEGVAVVLGQRAAHGDLVPGVEAIEEYERGVELLDRLIAAGRESASVGALPYPLAARAQGHLSLGRYDRARADAEEAVALAEQTSQDPALVIALGMLATVHAWRGDETEAVGLADRAVALGERRRIPLPAIYAKHALALLAVATDDAEAAVERLEVVRAEALPGNVLWTPHLVDAYVRAGRHADAAALVDFYARSIEHRRIAPAMLERLRGMTGDDGDAHFRKALELHRAGPAPFELARTQLARGEWLQAHERREEARDALREGLAGFERVQALRFAERTRRALRAAGASPRAVAERDPGELTPHELRVAQLVAQGLTNRETAAALFVSAKTVEHHLRNVFRKLGIRRRAELARLMAAR